MNGQFNFNQNINSASIDRYDIKNGNKKLNASDFVPNYYTLDISREEVSTIKQYNLDLKMAS